MKSKKLFLFIIISIVISIFTRFHNLENFYTETDDVLSIEQLLRYEKLELYDIANEKNSPSYNSKLKSYLRELQSKNNNLIDYAQKNISNILFNLSPSKHSTFAPLQFFMFGWMVNSDQNYNDLKFYSRIPSAIFSILTIFITYLLCKKIFKDEIYFLFLPCLLLICSYPIILISQRSYNYSAGVFGITLLFYLFLRETINLNDTKAFIDKSKIRFKNNFYFSLMLVSTSYLTYISVVLMPAFFIFKFAKNYLNKQKILTVSNYNLLICGLMYFIMVLPLVSYMLTLELHNYGARASSGLYGEYSIIGKEHSYIKFFLYNFYLIVTKNLSFFLEDFVGANIMQGFIFLITMIGIMNIFQKNIHNNYQILLNLFVLILLYWIVLVFFNITTFGPTRHLLMFTPIMAIIFTYGLKTLNKLIFKSKFFFSISITVSIILIFLLNYSNFLYYYKDLYDEKNLNSLIKKYNIQYLVNDVSMAHQICLMPSINIKINTCPIRNFRYSNVQELNQNIYKEVKTNSGSIAFISYNITDKINLDLINNSFNKIFAIKDVKFLEYFTSLSNKSPLYVSKQTPNYIEIVVYK